MKPCTDKEEKLLIIKGKLSFSDEPEPYVQHGASVLQVEKDWTHCSFLGLCHTHDPTDH